MSGYFLFSGFNYLCRSGLNCMNSQMFMFSTPLYYDHFTDSQLIDVFLFLPVLIFKTLS
ncbi:rCG53317 [Rattus norvegicus]|uniref:RCG53317 n=1 Tax=Rattus norvegicus TaxID=10116 RepID=A6JMV0_RAT|nr:rCG53317 [Rattus norvegicus]